MGRFVVVEGLDGAGTTTQSARLAAWLRTGGAEVVETREPTEGPVGRVLRAVLRGDPQAPDVRALPWLFAADRADHLYRTVEPGLARGWVVSDRYYHSSLAYQSLTLPLERVHALNADFRAPDLTVFVEVSVEVCLDRIDRRGAATREIYEERDRLVAIAERYRAVMGFLAARGERIATVDGSAPIEQVELAIREQVERL